MSVLDDLFSGDSGRIWAASWEVIRSRDTALLLRLAERAPEIRTATRDVELGGRLRPKRAALDFALQWLAFHAADHGCPCALYLSFDLYDPEREAGEGNVVILDDVHVEGRPIGGTAAHARCAAAGTMSSARNITTHGGSGPWKTCDRPGSRVRAAGWAPPRRRGRGTGDRPCGTRPIGLGRTLQ